MAKKKNVRPEYIQLELIPLTETEKLYKEFKEVKESSDKVRRGIFAKNTELAKKVTELTCQIESLKNQIMVMAQWMITQHGFAYPAESNTVLELYETTQLHVTQVNVAFAEKLHRSHTLEIMDIQILSA